MRHGLSAKRCLAALLAVCLLLVLLPAAAFAADTADGAKQLTAQEIAGESRIETSEPDKAAQYDDDEIVTVIVHLDAPAVMDYFEGGDGISAAAEDGSALCAGEAVSEFLTSDAAASLSEEMLSAQQEVVDAIGRISAESAETEVVAQWTNLVNGVAIKVPYGKLAEIRSLAGVKNAYVQITYDRPEEPATDAGIAGYSYDLVGINEVWTSGYTGAGMLVAVLDTGLDVEWKTYWDDEAGDNITGVRRVHEAFTDASFKTDEGYAEVRWTSSAIKRFVEGTLLAANTGPDGGIILYDNNALYKTRKIPFAADYADGDVNVRPTSSDHGTHVAGTIAGYAESEEGVVFSGIAPDAQILAMKVFPDTDGGAEETSILNALNDAALLGADVVNLSLGSDNGFSEDDTLANEAYENLYQAGILFMTSAGNAAYSSANSHYGDYAPAADPEISMISSPAVYRSNLSVASVDNTVELYSYFTWTDEGGTEHSVPFIDPTGSAMKAQFASGETELVYVPGYGTYNDYYEAGFRSWYGYGDKGASGIALVQRGGEISFADKINNARSFYWSGYDSATGTYLNEYPVKAVIVYDNVEGALITMNTDGAVLASAFISKADGDALAAALQSGYPVTIRVSKQDALSAWEEGGGMSEFSSWGAGPALELKPEITAPGGNIYSSIRDTAYAEHSGTYSDYVGSYGMMSGTSMAAPHMTGITALVKQYVQEQYGLSSADAAALTEKLLVSTAIPLSDGTTDYSPRLQGAGLVSAAGAIGTSAYITVDGGIGKLELKDDPQKTGIYELRFTVVNLTNDTLTYDAEAVVLRPSTIDSDGKTLMTDSDTLIAQISLGTVTVSAGGSAEVSRTIELTQAQKQELDALFENGTYIEGFVKLTDAAGVNVQIGLPFLAFYGDWTKAPIFDRALWTDTTDDNSLDNECTWGVSLLGYYDGYDFVTLGQNPFDSDAANTQTIYYNENITIAPNTGYFQSINDIELYQLREAKLVVVEVRDAETNELYYRDYATYQFKTYYDATYGVGIPASLYSFTATDWDGTDLSGNVLPSGTQCVYTITAYGDGEYPAAQSEDGYTVTDFESIVPNENEPTFNGHAMDKSGDVISVSVLVDTEAPTLINNAVRVYEEQAEDGTMHTYIEGTFVDDGSIASVQVAPVVTRTYAEGYGDPAYSETKALLADSFCTEYIYDADTHEFTFKADVTQYTHKESWYGENNYYNFTWNGEVYIYGGDYGGNDRAYGIMVDTADGLIVMPSSAKLHVGSEFDLSVIDNTGAGLPLTRTSSNPAVATVDEFGHVVGVSAGQAVITVSNGVDSAVCVVAVEEYPTEVLDFDLSIDRFSGLKPNGQLVVKVTNLQPADVVLSEISWVVNEDEATRAYYEGQINCAQYTADGLQGYIYLTYGSADTPIPAGSGTLTVTLNGVSRTMAVDWEAAYSASGQDDLIADGQSQDQVIYVTAGETATLAAKYNDSSAHSVIPVALYTLEGAYQYGYSNPTTAANGLTLDGAPYAGNGASWTGKLVADPGYTLPETIQVGTRYSYGYEYWWENSYYTYYTYNPETGEIWVQNAPYGADSVMVIRADGVPTEGAPGGTKSGNTYETPDGIYGPFNWSLTEGSGELTTAEGVSDGYTTRNVAYFTPSEAGVHYITATNRDGTYSVNFAVVCEPVRADTVTLDANNLVLKMDETAALHATLSPEPTLAKDAAVAYDSFNPAVATVDENGVVTGVAPGYAYIKVTAASDSTVETYCVVQVLSSPRTVTFVAGDEVVREIQKEYGSCLTDADYPEVPVREGYTGEWMKYDQPITQNIRIYAAYTLATTEPTQPGSEPTQPSTPGSEPTQPSEPHDTPDTGDSATPLLTALLLAAISLAGLVTLTVRMRRRAQ